MSQRSLIDQLTDELNQKGLAAARQFIRSNASRFREAEAMELKLQADQLLRANVGRSVDTSQLLRELGQINDSPTYRALGLLAEANARSIGLGEHQQAVALYDEAAAIYQETGREVDQAKSQIGKLFALANLGRHEEALETATWASRVFEEHGEKLLLAKISVNMGIIHGRVGVDARALELFDRARDLYRALGKEGETFVPRVEYDRAIVLRNLGRFQASISASEAALGLLSGMNQPIDTARAQQSLAVTYFILSRYNHSLQLLQEVREAFLADGRQRDAILADLFISDCLLQLRRFGDVLEKCSQVREVFTGLGTRFEVAQALLNEAVAHTGLADYEEAERSLAEARRLFLEDGNEVWRAIADLEYAAILLRQGRAELALATALEAGGVLGARGAPYWQARANLVAGRAAMELKARDQAGQLAQEALRVGEADDIPWLTYQSRQMLSELARVDGNTDAALEQQDRAVHELERLRGRLMVEFRADFVQDKQLVYEDAVLLSLDLGLPERGFEYVERSKSRALLDMLDLRVDMSIRARSQDDRPLVEQLGNLRAERDRLVRRMGLDDELSERGRSLSEPTQTETVKLEERITQLWHTLLIRNADYAQEASIWHVRTEPIQDYLAPETMLVEYFVARGRMLAFLVTRQSIRVVQLPGQLNDVRAHLPRAWLNLKTVPRSPADRIPHLADKLKTVLCSLQEILIAPIEHQLADHAQLIIVPHGPLHYVPFHALHDGSAYLLERHLISYLPVASLLRYCQEVQSPTKDLVAIGHSKGGLLPYTVQEARSIAAIMGGSSLLEEQATLDRVRERAAACRSIHIATHGEFRSDNPLFSGLDLEDGSLTTLETFNWRLQASLVTLSACQTGWSVVGGGDELLGLMRAFLYAGAATLVLSLWAVHDRSTATLMELFYRNLVDGRSKGEALRGAQLSLLRGELGNGSDGAQRLAHPYFWAPFYLVGDTGPL